MTPLKGIHHVTAITGDAQGNADFYAGLLGLRLVKKTVNFDDPGSYHLYYGDAAGTPGTLVTFFAWPGATAGRTGVGEPVALTFEVPEGALSWWSERLSAAGFASPPPEKRFGVRVLGISDPDGMRVELVESMVPRETEFWAAGGVPKQHAITTIQGVTLAVREEERSAALYAGELTFAEAGNERGRRRFSVGTGEGRSFVDLVMPATVARGRMGAGTIHHVAFRTEDDASQEQWLSQLTTLGLHVSPVMDRKYFHSIYFRERNGVLFEIATDGPGMAVDEPPESLGEALTLPAEYEPLRATLERALPPIVVSPATQAANV